MTWLKAGSCFAAGRSTQAACGRVHTSTQHASEIARNSIAPLMEMQGKLKYAQLSAACGKVWTNQANSLFLLFVRPAAKYEPALIANYSYQSCARSSSNRTILVHYLHYKHTAPEVRQYIVTVRYTRILTRTIVWYCTTYISNSKKKTRGNAE